MDSRDMAKALGRRGGRTRALRLSAERRREIASLGGLARAQSLVAARRIAENFRYAAIIQELRGPSVTVTRVHAFAGPLPGLYPASRRAGALPHGLPRRGR